MANACLLEPQGVHEHQQSRDDDGDRHLHAGHSTALAEHHDDDQPSKAPCVKACGEASQSPAQRDTTASFDLAGLLPLPREAWAPAPAIEQVVERLGGAPHIPPEPPPRLRFARLAL